MIVIVLLSNGDHGGVDVAALGVSAVRDTNELVWSGSFTVPQVHNEGSL